MNKITIITPTWNQAEFIRDTYLQAEKTGRLSAKKRVDFASRVLFHLGGKRICSF